MHNEKEGNESSMETPKVVASELVKLSNNFARGQWGIQGIIAPKIIMNVAMQVQKGDIEFKNYRVPFSVISDRERLGSKSRQELLEVAQGLLSHEIRLEKEHGGFALYRLFAKFEVDFTNKAVEVSFHPDLSDGFMLLKGNFTLLSYLDFVSLSTGYSQRLYRLLSSWKNVKGNIKIIPLEDLHFTLETPPSLQKNFGDFNRRVLVKSVKEIKEKTQLYFEAEPEKNGGKKVVSIKFNFNPPNANSSEKNRLIALIVNEFCVSEKETQTHSANKSEEVLESFINYMRGVRKKKSNINDIASYARTTLVNFVPSKKDANTPRSFYESLSEGKKIAWQKEFMAANKIPENLEAIVKPGLNESNEDFLNFITLAREQSSVKAEEKQKVRKTNEGWNKAKVILKEKLASGYATWIEPVDYWDEDDTTLQLIAADGDRYFAKYLETNYLADIEDALEEVGITKEVVFHF